MRISDWSSDVCSSDLAGRLPAGIAMSEDDVVDAFGIDPAAFDQRLDDRGAQLPRRQRGKAAAEFPDGGPKRRNDGGSTQCHDVNSCRFTGLRVYGLGRWLWMELSS